MAYGRSKHLGGGMHSGHKAIIGTKLAGGKKRGPGLKLHSDMKESHAHGAKHATKAARKAV